MEKQKSIDSFIILIMFLIASLQVWVLCSLVK